MILWIKGNDVELETALSPLEFISLVDIQNRGDLRCSISVSRGERVGYIPLEDFDVDRTMKSLENPDQLPLVLL